MRVRLTSMRTVHARVFFFQFAFLVRGTLFFSCCTFLEMSSLPVEAWHVVLDYVVAPLPAQFQNPYHPLEFEGGDEYKASIRLLEALSLVCRSMHSLASRHLWKEGFIRLKLSAEAKKLIENPIVCARLTHIVLHHERPGTS